MSYSIVNYNIPYFFNSLFPKYNNNTSQINYDQKPITITPTDPSIVSQFDFDNVFKNIPNPNTYNTRLTNNCNSYYNTLISGTSPTGPSFCSSLSSGSGSGSSSNNKFDINNFLNSNYITTYVEDGVNRNTDNDATDANLPEKTNLNNKYNDLKTINTDVVSNINKINNKLKGLYNLIDKQKSINQNLVTNVEEITIEQNVLRKLIGDYTTIYKNNYNRNWSLFISILIALLIIKVVYTV
jgi:hypothetical protein